MMYYTAGKPTAQGITSATLQMARGGELYIVNGTTSVRVNAYPDGSLHIVDPKTGKTFQLPVSR